MRNEFIAAAVVVAACTPADLPGPALPLVTAVVEPGAVAGVTGEERFDVAATRDGEPAPADCTAEGSGFRATFTSPARIAVPSFGPASQPIRVACAADGRRGGRVVLPAFRGSGGYGAVFPSIGVGIGSDGGAGVSIGGVWNPGTSGGQFYSVRYPDVEIALR